MKNSIIIFILGLLAYSCGGDKPAEERSDVKQMEHHVTLTDVQVKNAGLKVGAAETRSIASILRVNGKIDVPPQNMVSISVPLGGFLKSTQLLPGMKISKGQVIAVMEDQSYIQLQQEYLMAKAKLIYLEKEYDRQKELNQSKATSDKTFQQAEADYRSQKINERSLGEKLRLIHLDPEKLSENSISRQISIQAPIDGYVSKVNVNIGKYVNPTDVLFELVNPNDIHLNLTVFERDIDKLFVGQKLVAFTNNDRTNKHKCEILLIGQNLSAERNIEVHCHFEDYDKSLIPGMYMNAEIEVKSMNSMVVPEDAIVAHDGKSYVFVESGKNEFELMQVELGITEKSFTEIKTANASQLNKVVLVGAYSLLMELKNTSEE